MDSNPQSPVKKGHLVEMFDLSSTSPPRGTEGSNPSSSGSQSVSPVPSAATGTKGPAFAANVSLDETRERDMLASNRLAFAFVL